MSVVSKRRGYAQDRFIGKQGGTFGHGVHMTRKPEGGEPVDQGGFEASAPGQPSDVL